MLRSQCCVRYSLHNVVEENYKTIVVVDSDSQCTALYFLSCIFLLYYVYRVAGWWSGVVVSALASINEVNQRRAQLVRRWVTVFGFNSR